MEKNRRETTIHSEGRNVKNGDETAISSNLDEQDGSQEESEPVPIERTKVAMENIGTKIYNI
jgi:hypothetical protein